MTQTDKKELENFRTEKLERDLAEHKKREADRLEKWNNRDWTREGASDVFTLEIKGGTLVRVGEKIGFVGNTMHTSYSHGSYGYAVPASSNILWL